MIGLSMGSIVSNTNALTLFESFSERAERPGTFSIVRSMPLTTCTRLPLLVSRLVPRERTDKGREKEGRHVVTERQHLPQRRMQLLRAQLSQLTGVRPGADILDALHLATQLDSRRAGEVEEHFAEGVGGRGGGGAETALAGGRGGTSAFHRFREVGDGRFGNVVCCFAEKTVKEVGASERACSRAAIADQLLPPRESVLSEVNAATHP